MGVLRLSHLELRVTDLELAAAYYTEVLGLVEVARDHDHAYLACWDERDHHSLALSVRPTAGVEHLSFKVECADDLDALEAAALRHGCATRRLAAGEEVGQGQAVRIQAPSGHDVELVHARPKTGGLLPRVNPLPEPPGLLGIHPPRLDHVQVTAEDVAGATAFFTDVLGFRLTERLVAGSGALLGSWLERSHTANDVAITRGPNGGLHHFAFWLDDWNEVRNAADTLAYHGVPIDVGPTRHGVTRGFTIYFFDPVGNRNEVFTGGYWVDPDFETITWTEDQMGRAIFYYEGQVNERFFTVHS